MVGATILSDWIAYTNIISRCNIQNPFKTNIIYQKKQKRRGVWDVNSTISDSNLEFRCGGHISYFLPRGLCISSFEMSRVCVTSYYPWYFQHCQL